MSWCQAVALGPGLLDQGLVVPDAHAVRPGQFGGHAADAGIQDELLDRGIVLPQVEALDEDVVVEGAIVSPACVVHGAVDDQLAVLAFAYGLVHGVAPGLEFLGGEEVIDHDETVGLIGVNLGLCDFRVHGISLSHRGILPLQQRPNVEGSCSATGTAPL